MLEKICVADECGSGARMAVRTLRQTRADLHTTVYYDDRSAPKAAMPYCKAHGIQLVIELAETLVSNDA